MTYATKQDIEDQFTGISFDRAQASTTLIAASGAEVVVSADPDGDYNGEAGNGIAVEIVNNNSDGELSVAFENDTITIELGGADQSADDIAYEVGRLADFIGQERKPGDFTSTDTTSQELVGGDDESVIDQALDEASRLVESYKLMVFGYTDQASDNAVVDYSHDFINEGIETDTKLWKIDLAGNKELVDKEPAEGTVDSVETYTLTYTPEYSDFGFEADERYMVEDVARRKRAEIYKACALLFANLTSSAEVASGVEVVQVGEIEVEYGDIEAVSNAIAGNPFENKFANIVGTGY